MSAIEPGSAAELAGLEVDDIIIRINDKRIENSRELANAIGLKGSGEDVDIEFVRDSENLHVTATLGQQIVSQRRGNDIHPAFLVTAADAISGSRPGARREMFEGYVKRLEKLEEIAMEHPGVERCFAIQAGRELRVMVEPEKVSDVEMARISEAVARRIEGELQYPGQIKVVVVRETRSVDFAR